MSKPTVNWNSVDTWQRVVASILATGVKVEIKATASYFGTTYDTLENRFRKIKKDAEVLKQEVESGEREAVVTPSRPRSAPSTPRKKRGGKEGADAVSTGRVTKKTTGEKKVVKAEPMEECAAAAAATGMEGVEQVETPVDSLFDFGGGMSFGGTDSLFN